MKGEILRTTKTCQNYACFKMDNTIMKETNKIVTKYEYIMQIENNKCIPKIH